MNPYRLVGERLLEPAGPDLWPLAVIYFNNETKGLTVAVAGPGAELLVGHGKKIGRRIEESAKEMLRDEARARQAAAQSNLGVPQGLHGLRHGDPGGTPEVPGLPGDDDPDRGGGGLDDASEPPDAG